MAEEAAKHLCAGCMRGFVRTNAICPRCGFSESAWQPRLSDLPPHTRLSGRYEVGRTIGRGGFGVLYLAHDEVLNRRIAIKEFFVDGAMYRDSSRSLSVFTVGSSQAEQERIARSWERFRQEARITAALEQTGHIVSIYDLFEENATIYMSMEYLEGVTLRTYLANEGGRLSWEAMTALLMPVIRSVDLVHRQGVLHRDISPDNMIVSGEGYVTLFDFGGAAGIQEQDPEQMFFRKVGYSPIEQYKAEKQGPWTDVYAMAATMYECLSGGKPPEAPLRAEKEDPIVLPTKKGVKISKKRERVLMKALSVDPAKRFETMAEFGEALNAADRLIS